MKKLTALLLAVLMVFALSACSQTPATTEPTDAPDPTTEPTTQTTTEPTTEPTTQPTEPSKFDAALCAEVIGVWQTAIVLDGSLMNMNEMEDSTSFSVTYTFDDTGAYTISLNVNEFQTAIADYETLLVQYMVESLYAKFSAECKLEGMKKSEITAAWDEQEKAAAQASAEQLVTGMNLSSIFTPLGRAGDYYVEDGRLYVSTGDETYESYLFALEEGSLLLSECDNADFYRAMYIEFPLTLTPVNE